MSVPTNSNRLPLNTTVISVGVLSVQSLRFMPDIFKLSYKCRFQYVASNKAGLLCRTSVAPLDGPYVLHSVPNELSVCLAKLGRTVVALHPPSIGRLVRHHSRIGIAISEVGHFLQFCYIVDLPSVQPETPDLLQLFHCRFSIVLLCFQGLFNFQTRFCSDVITVLT